MKKLRLLLLSILSLLSLSAFSQTKVTDLTDSRSSNFLYPTTEVKNAITGFNEMREAMLNLEVEKAKNLSDSLVSLDPNWASAHLGQLNYYYTLKDSVKFRECYNLATSKLKGASTAEYHFILVYNPAGNLASVRCHLDTALMAASDDLQIRVYRAHFEENTKSSIDILLPAWKRFPENGSVNNALGYAYMEDGQMKKAKQHFESYVRAYPNAPNAYDSYADYYVKAGDKAKAKEMYLKAYELDNTWIESKKRADEL
jgi:tetratricopeptide (TPR) repeat protein